MSAPRRVTALLALLTLFLSFPICARAEKPPLLYFYENYCESCSLEQAFLRDFGALTGQSAEGYACSFYDMQKGASRAALDAAIETYKIPEDKQRLPLLILDGVVYAGNTEIQRSLPQDFARDESSRESVVYYLYVSACESCARAAVVLDALPEQVRVQRGLFSFDSPVRVERINIGQNTPLALALFEEYRVPEDARIAPMAFVKDRYFAGANAIERGLASAVELGQAVGNALMTEAAPPLPPARIGPAALAGLVGGLNPCALSMLLLFLSLLLPLKKDAGRYAASFLLSKFITYLLIGTLLLSLLQAWNPSWLPRALKLFLSAYCIVLIVLNLSDAWAAHREAYGQVRNQLPRRVRGFLQSRIKDAMAAPGRLLPAVVSLGALVAVSEFLCAGQVYLATLLASLQHGSGVQRLLPLVSYCVGFIAPSAALCVVLLRGKAMFEVSEWVRGRMSLIKLLTALLFALVLAYVWYW